MTSPPTSAGSTTVLTTMTPVIRTGRSCLDRRRLPRDEHARRVAEVEALAASEQLAAVVVVANAASPGAVVHLANLAPTAGAATVVIVPGHGAVLMAGRGGQREEPYQRDVTWIPSLLQRPFGAESIVRVLAERGVTRGRVGIAGLDDQVPVRVRDRFVAEMGGIDLVPVDRQMAELRRRLSVRERSILGEVERLVEGALGRGAAAFAASGVPADGALAVEEDLYAAGCRDVRLLLGRPDGSLRPFEAMDDRPGPVFSCYAAAELLGYWSERAVTISAAPGGAGAATTDVEAVVGAAVADLEAVVGAAAERLRPGADPATVAEAAGAGGAEVLVRGLGTELVALPDAESGWTDLRAGDAVSVVALGRAAGHLALCARTFAVGGQGPRSLATVVIPGL